MHNVGPHSLPPTSSLAHVVINGFGRIYNSCEVPSIKHHAMGPAGSIRRETTRADRLCRRQGLTHGAADDGDRSSGRHVNASRNHRAQFTQKQALIKVE